MTETIVVSTNDENFYQVTYQCLGNLNATKAILIFDLPLQPALLLDKFYPLFQEEFQIILCQLPVNFPLVPEEGMLIRGLFSKIAEKTHSKKLHLVGGSLATPYLLNTALAQSELVASLLLYSPFLEISPQIEDVLDDMIWALEHPRKDYLFPSRFLNLFIKEERHFSDYQEQLEALNKSPRFELANHIRAIQHWVDFLPTFSSLSVPTHVILGKGDIVFSYDYAKRVRSLLPRATVAELWGAGHFCLRDKPMDVLNITQTEKELL